MARIYYNMIIDNNYSFAKVPVKWRASVKQLLIASGHSDKI